MLSSAWAASIAASRDRFNDPLQFFTGSTVGERSADTGVSQQLTRELLNGNRASDYANDFLGQVAGGDFMQPGGGNPYLDDTFDVLSDRIGEKFNQIVTPTVNSRFAASGRSGSPAAGRARGRTDETLARELGELGTQIYYGDYEQRLGDRFSAAQLAPSLDQNELGLIGSVGAVGADNENYTQRLVNDAIQRFNFAQNEPEVRLDSYINRVQGAAGGYGTNQQVVPTGDSTGSAIAGVAGILTTLVGGLV